MDPLGIVVVQLEGNGFVELVQVVVVFEWSEFQLETAEEALHETVLPGTGPLAATEGNFQLVAEQLVLVAQVLAALVTVEYCRRRVFAEAIEQGGERQLAAVSQPKPPAKHLSGFQVEHHRQVVPLTLEPQVGKILHPGSGVRHAGVALAVLGAALITEDSILSQGIGGSWNLGWCRSCMLGLLARPGNDNAAERPDAPGFLLAPAQMQRQPPDTVERMVFVGGVEPPGRTPVRGRTGGGVAVAGRSGEGGGGEVMGKPPWVDFLQDG